MSSIASMARNNDTPSVLKSSCSAIVHASELDFTASHSYADATLRSVRAREIEAYAFDHVVAGLILSGNLSQASRAVCMIAGLENWVEFSVFDDIEGLSATVIEYGFEKENTVAVRLQKGAFIEPDSFSTMRRVYQTLSLFDHFARLRSEGSNAVLIDISDFGDKQTLSFSGHEIANLVPDSFFLSDYGYLTLRKHFTSNWIPWKDRRDVFFWRGSTTGMYSNWRDLPRIRLCQWGRDRGSPIDFLISDMVQRSEREKSEIMQESICGNHVPANKFIEFKYHVDIDGNTNSWPGLFIKLLTGSPVLKVESENNWKQWYYDRLVPWSNYVPVSSDMSDLGEVVDKLTKNPSLAEAIGINGRNLALDLSYVAELDRSVEKINRMSTEHSAFAARFQQD